MEKGRSPSLIYPIDCEYDNCPSDGQVEEHCIGMISHPMSQKPTLAMLLRSMNWTRPVVFAALISAGIGATLADNDKHNTKSPGTEERRLIIHSGTLFTKDGVPINLSGFDSEIESGKPAQAGANGAPKQIEDVIVRSGNAFIRAQDLSKLLKTHINQDKLNDLALETDGDEIKISGHLKKAIPLHFEIKGPVSLTQAGLIDLHEASMKVDKLPMKGLADILGMDASKVVGKDPKKGLQATKTDILMDPAELWGMSIHGKLTTVKVVNNGLMLVYGSAPTREKKIAHLNRGN